jgi:hypothetical protein
LSLKKITFQKCYLIIGFCNVLALLHTSAPLVGWSYFSPEGALVTCSIEWAERSFSVISYNVFIFISTWGKHIFLNQILKILKEVLNSYFNYSVLPCAIMIPASFKLLAIVK